MSSYSARVLQVELNDSLTAEIERSKVEARRLQHVDLTMRDVARYDDPPADTIYPLEYAYHLLPDVEDCDVLDYGCGDGRNTVGLLRRGAYVTALDLSQALIHVAARRVLANVCDKFNYGQVIFACSDAEDTGLPNDSFHVVFGTAILHHLNLDRAMREVYRLLKPGGVAIFKEPIRNSKLVRAIRRAIPYTTPETSPDERPLLTADIERAIGNAGFSASSYKDFLLPSTNVIETFLPRFARASYRLDAWLLNRFKFLRYYASQRVLIVKKPSY